MTAYADLIPGPSPSRRESAYDDLLPGGTPAPTGQPAEDVRVAGAETATVPRVSAAVRRLNEERVASQPARMTLTRGGAPVLEAADLSLQEPPAREADWGEVASSIIPAAGAQIRSAFANLRRMGNEEAIQQTEQVLKPQTIPGGGDVPLLVQRALERKRAQLARDVAARPEIEADAKAAGIDLADVTPKDMTTLQKAVFSAGSSAPTTLAGIATAIATRSPGLGMLVGGAGGSTVQAGSTYGEARDKGATHDLASTAAGMDAIIEGLDAIPIGVAMKAGSPFLKRMAKTAASEGLTEAAQQALQDLRSMAMEDPDKTLGEVWENMKVAGLAGMIGGTAFGGIGSAANAGRPKAAPMRSPEAGATQPAVEAPAPVQAPAAPVGAAPVVQPAAPVAATAPAAPAVEAPVAPAQPGAYADLVPRQMEMFGMPADDPIAKVVQAGVDSKRAGNETWTTYRPVDENEAKALKDAAGLDLVGYKHHVDEAAVRHILNRHGDPQVEARRGQIAITPEDFAKLPEITDPLTAHVEAGGKTPAGLETVVYTKRIGDVYYAVEEVRVGRKRLALKSMRKTRAAPGATPEGGVPQTSETLGAQPVESLSPEQEDGNLGMAATVPGPAGATTTGSTPIAPPIPAQAPNAVAASSTVPPASGVSNAEARPDAIRAAMRELFGTPISEKGLSKKYLGIYKIRPQTIRLQNRNDLRTASHEVGHHISNTNRPFRKIMRQHGAELIAIAPRAYHAQAVSKFGSLQKAVADPEMRRFLIEEGFAEFIAEYLTSPKTLQAKVPGFHAQFETWLGENEKYATALAKVQAMVGAHQQLGPEDKILAKVGAFKPPLLKRAADFASRDTWNTFVQASLDKWHPAKVMEQELAPAGVAPSKSPYAAFRLLSGDAAVIEDWVTDFTSPYDFQKRLDTKNYGKSLKAILDPVMQRGEAEVNKFKAYLIARRAAELMKVGKENLFTRQEIADGLALETPEFKQVAKEVYAYNDRLVEYAVEGGLLSPDVAAQFKQYANYIPFFRESEGDAKGGGKSDPFKKLTGGTQNLRDPIANLIQNTANIIHATNRNAALRKAVDFAKEIPGGGRFLEQVAVPQQAQTVATQRIIDELSKQGVQIDTAMAQNLATIQTFFTPSTRGDERTRTIVYKDGGDLRAVQVNDPLLWKSLGNLPPLEMNLIGKMLAFPAQTLRAGVVLDPTFMVRNFVRDTLSAMVQSKGAFIPVVTTAQGMKMMAQQQDAYRLWRAFGGAFGDQFHDPDQGARIIERMAKRGGFEPSSIVSPVRWLDALRKVGSYTESGSRIGEFAATYKPGDVESALAAALNAREVSTDFGMRGGSEAIQVLTRITPFLNPALQGLYKTARVLSGSDGKAAVAKAAMLGSAMALASMALALLNSGDDWYKRIEEWEKGTYWHFKLGEQVFRIPKPFEYGTFFASIPEAMALWFAGQEGGEDFKKRMLQALGQVLGFRLIPQAATIVAEPWANKSIFTGRALVPDRQKNLEPGLQSNPSTTKVAQVAGESANVSPAVIDNVVRNVFGTLGVHASAVADLMLEGAGVVPPGKERGWQTWPVLKAFVRDPDNPNTKQQRDFYEQLEKYRKAVNTVRELKARGEDAKAEAYSVEKSDEIAQARAAEGAAKRIAKLRKDLRAIEWDRELTPAQKRADARDINAEIQSVAEEQTRLYQAAKKSYARPAVEGGQQ